MIKDILKPKSEEDIINDLNKLSKIDLNNKLINAARNGLINVVQYLINAGSDINYNDNNVDYTPLMYATLQNHKKIVKLLIKNGANVNIKSVSGWSALTLSIYQGWNDIIKILFDNGALIDFNNFEDMFKLRRAITNGHRDSVDLIRKLFKQNL